MHVIHTSIPVRDPRQAAEAVSKLCGGAVYKFLHPGCYFVMLGEPGALIEFYRKEIELRPGPPGEECRLVDVAEPPRYTGSHTAVRMAASAEAVLQTARDYGWRAEVHRRKIFRVIEFWIENEYLLEVFPADFADEYIKACGMLAHVPAEPIGGDH